VRHDSPDRDPLTWKLEGSNSQNLSEWKEVDRRTNETFASRGQTNYYTFANTTGYAVYRFTVIANNGNLNFGGEFQVAEIQLFGDPSPVDGGPDASTSGDGAPDASLE
jgi:hypothetical protein